MTAEEKLKEGTIYYVDRHNGDNRSDGLDHGGWIVKDGVTIRNIHWLRTIQKAMDKCST